MLLKKLQPTFKCQRLNEKSMCKTLQATCNFKEKKLLIVLQSPRGWYSKGAYAFHRNTKCQLSSISATGAGQALSAFLTSRNSCRICYCAITLFDLPCFPDNKTGLILIFTPKFTLGLIFSGCLILIYEKMKLQSKN